MNWIEHPQHGYEVLGPTPKQARDEQRHQASLDRYREISEVLRRVREALTDPFSANLIIVRALDIIDDYMKPPNKKGD